jgi:asparagine N-glycosylation enzyme membrane subunit Stt3
MHLGAHVGKEFSGSFIIVMFLLLTFTFVLPSPMAQFPRVLDHAYSPTTIAAGSMPVRPTDPVRDWLDALNWMRVNLKSTDVVACWWDYGYWITIIANKTTLADNGTVNVTQIAQIGLMFLSNETEAIKILNEYGATYIVVFTTFDTSGNDANWGDEGKWRWMARIAGLNESIYGSTDPDTGRWTWNELGQSTVIYKLMTYGKKEVLPDVTSVQELPLEPLQHFEKAYFSQTADNRRTYAGAIPLVCVYKINYTQLASS